MRKLIFLFGVGAAIAIGMTSLAGTGKHFTGSEHDGGTSRSPACGFASHPARGGGRRRLSMNLRPLR